jgi:hypothetical protein
MPKGRLGAEQIVTKLRQIEVLQGQGKSVSVACKEAGTTEQTYYRCAESTAASMLRRPSA